MSQALLSAEHMAALVEGRVADPHTLLGMHPLGKGRGVVVRALRPDSRAAILVETETGRETPLTRIHPVGLYEGVVPDRDQVFRYHFKFEGFNDLTLEVRDAYAFLPTLGEFDIHLAAEGRHEELYRSLGAHPMRLGDASGVRFAVWAPNATRVSVVGDWNYWDGRYNMMRRLGESGIWELFVPGLGAGPHYRYEIRRPTGAVDLRSDPLAFGAELRPKVASRVVDLDSYVWTDEDWMARRRESRPMEGPMSIYEVHLASWMRHPDGTFLTYAELADKLIPHVKDLGFTHLELLPVMEHPFDGSWGYQVTGYFAATRRHGSPQELMAFIDRCHREGIGVILDWVPAHFPRDRFALAEFDGTALYEHADPRQGEHPDWDTLIFNYGRHEVRNFLIASALFWLDRYHADGLRVDAVASMLYLDYSREPGEWVPNQHGGRENLEAISLLQELNEVVHRRFPGVAMIAEESQSWPGGVTHPPSSGGLGFDAMWNMGFMHDMLAYMKEDPLFRVHHQGKLTFSLFYAYNERFVLPFSHDEVVHGKASMVGKMPGDEWQKFANLRVLYAYQWAHPGKKLLFMGAELAPWREWSDDRELEWELLQFAPHRGIRDLVRHLGQVYRDEPSLWQRDNDWEGFQWIDFSDAAQNVVSWLRRGTQDNDFLVCVFNLSPVPRHDYRVGVPQAASYHIVLNTDDEPFGGSGAGPATALQVEDEAAHGLDRSIRVTLPPLAALYLKPVF